MNKLITPLLGMAICAILLVGIIYFVFIPESKPVWTDQGKITSMTSTSWNGLLRDWEFTVLTDNHGTVSPVISNCGWEIVGNTVYVTMLADGKLAQTDSVGNLICTS